MSDEQILRAKAREAMRTGRLANVRPERIWGGPGTGASCAVCSETIGRNQSELEIQFETGRKAEETTHHVHVRCFAAWEFERRNGHALPEDGEKNTMNLHERSAANGAGAG